MLSRKGVPQSNAWPTLGMCPLAEPVPPVASMSFAILADSGEEHSEPTVSNPLNQIARTMCQPRVPTPAFVMGVWLPLPWIWRTQRAVVSNNILMAALECNLAAHVHPEGTRHTVCSRRQFGVRVQTAS